MTQHAPPTRIWMISHPANRTQMEGFFPADDALDDHAIASMEGVVWRPNAQVKVWTSPEVRTRETAGALGFTAEVAAELRECDFGDWAGQSLEAVFTADPAGCASWLSDLTAKPHHGESFRDLLTRVGEWLDGQQKAGPCVVVAHASVIRAAIVHALGAPAEAFQRIEVAPLTLTDLRCNGPQWSVRSMALPLKGLTSLRLD
jgi:broad specificity phosphatase PhoE